LSCQLAQEKKEYLKREKELNQKILEVQNQKDTLEKDKEGLLKKNKDQETQFAKLSEQTARVMVQYGEAEKQKQATAIESQGCLQETRLIQDKLKSSELLVVSLQLEVEALKKASKDLEVQINNIKLQKEQEDETKEGQKKIG